MRWVEKYIGLPFRDHGRSINGVDCWGLVQLVMREQNNIELPDYGETSALDLEAVAKMVAQESAIDPWVPVIPHNVQMFDVVVMHRRREPVHVGIMVNKFMVLHIEKKTDSVLMPLSDARISFRYPRFYRHRDLIQHHAA